MSQKAYEVITDRIIKLMEQGTVPWRKPWGSDQAGLGTNQSLVSKKCYRGVNALLTASKGYSSPYWVTFKQALELGGSVRKGESGTPIVFLGQGKRKDEQGEEEAFKFLRYYTVFNAEQCEGIEYPKEEAKPRPFESIAKADQIAYSMPLLPRIEHQGNQAFYHPSFDYVRMPPKESFATPEGYYSTLFHELGHSTGHKDRLNRESLQKIAGFGTHEYSKEELVAEMSAAFLCHHAGITDPTINNTASYIASWLKVLRNDPKFIVSASAQAQKAADYILGVKP